MDMADKNRAVRFGKALQVGHDAVGMLGHIDFGV